MSSSWFIHKHKETTTAMVLPWTLVADERSRKMEEQKDGVSIARIQNRGPEQVIIAGRAPGS